MRKRTTQILLDAVARGLANVGAIFAKPVPILIRVKQLDEEESGSANSCNVCSGKK